MRSVSRSALVPFMPQQMFDLVADVNRYPEFLPWCRDARVESRDADQMLASLTLSQAGFSETFTTRNGLSEPESITLELVSGPFDQLQGEWSFRPMGDSGCRVGLDISFRFSSRITEGVLGPVFEAICNRLVDAFVQRAKKLYAKR